jgi:hypothetical protein
MRAEQTEIVALGETLRPLAQRVSWDVVEAHYLVHRAVVRGLKERDRSRQALRRAMRDELGRALSEMRAI